MSEPESSLTDSVDPRERSREEHADRNGNDQQETCMRPKNSRKRKKESQQQQLENLEETSGTEGADGEDTDGGPNPEEQQQPSTSQSPRNKKARRRRKHHSHPKRKERNLVPTESDYLVYSPTNRTATTTAATTSSVSDAEDFELLDEFSNLYASARLFDRPPGGPRPIAIDGCNVAWGHGNDQEFSYKGIVLCADYFRARGHTVVKAFVPRQHQHLIPKQVVDELTRDEILVFTPSRKLGNQGKRISSYDDRFIVQYAVITGGIVISNDNFQDLYNEQPAWRDTIANRVLQHTWISKDILMFPLDPLGRKGKQSLDDFLHFPKQPQLTTTTTAVTPPASAVSSSPSSLNQSNVSSIGSSTFSSSSSSWLRSKKSVSWKSLHTLSNAEMTDSETEEEEEE